jgi:N-acyl homoserine lactone hydrolase
MKTKLFFALLLFCGVLFYFNTRSEKLPKPSVYQGELPLANPPKEMSITAIQTGYIHRSAGFAYRGGSWFDKRDFTMSAALIKHPNGDLLIDTGFGNDIEAHYSSMPFWFRVMTSFEKTKSVAQQLDSAGYDKSKLRGIILTHAHWDHISGLPDFKHTPVLITHAEQDFIKTGGSIMSVAQGFKDINYQEYSFENSPYLGFEKSHDIYGDGSVVIVPAPGHTPGSVIIFIALPNEQRFAMVGDLVWQQEGIKLREERPWMQSKSADDDHLLLRKSLLKMSSIAEKFPAMIITPAHDSRGFMKMGQL